MFRRHLRRMVIGGDETLAIFYQVFRYIVVKQRRLIFRFECRSMKKKVKWYFKVKLLDTSSQWAHFSPLHSLHMSVNFWFIVLKCSCGCVSYVLILHIFFTEKTWCRKPVEKLVGISHVFPFLLTPKKKSTLLGSEVTSNIIN